MKTETGDIAMKLDFDVEKLQQVADDFYHATGVGIFVIGSDFTDVKAKSTRYNPYCAVVRSKEQGRVKCAMSDDELIRKCGRSKQPEINVCHGGLVNIAAPIMYEENVVGYVFFSSLRSGSFENAVSEFYDSTADLEQMREYYDRIQPYDEKRFKSIINLAVMLAQHIILAKMIRPSTDENLQRVKSYIKYNLSSDLSIKKISAGTNISKSVLYRLFAKYFGCTVTEYVNQKRIEEAGKLLISTGYSVAEIAERVGFSSAVHFRTMFKKINGTTPLHYRKENRMQAGE